MTGGRPGPRRRRTALAVLCVVLGASGALAGQTQPPAPAPGSTAAALASQRVAESFTLFFYNRPIVVFRARVLGRSPSERAGGAGRLLHDLVAQRVTGPVEARPFESGTIINVASRIVFMIAAEDVDDLAGETLDGVTAKATASLQQALSEADEARAPWVLLRSSALAAAAIAAALLVLWTLTRARQRISAALLGVAERKMAKVGDAALEALRTSRVIDVQRHLITAGLTAIDLVVIYSATTFVLRQFPYTRAWGESMSGFLLMTVETLTLNAMRALPGLFTVAIIFTVTRLLVRAAGAWFHAVERGQAHSRWIHPETATPTRRLVAALLWIFAAVVAYPYMPGSQTDAFKGVSVFLGLMVTFGSSGLVNQIMSGFMVTYSRALRVGDFVKIGDVEGTVEHIGVLSTKVRTLKNEEVTIPNAVVVAQTTTDYSRLADSEGVFTPTSVTIGYDAPWRQVHELLLQAAARTPGLRADPKPVVLQAGLEDFYVKYTLFVCLERQQSRPFTLGALHANIQDLFNEYGVQIMSPNYVLDPAAPKLVPKDQWFAAPASPAASQDIGTVHSTRSSAPALSGGRPAE
jgi:small-conductance mechanosensitive channel